MKLPHSFLSHAYYRSKASTFLRAQQKSKFLRVFGMRWCSAVASLMLVLAWPFAALAQSAAEPGRMASEVTVGPADPQISAVLQDVSAEKIRANIEKLVSFG